MPPKNTEQLDNLRHSCAHLLAAAVMELWPTAKRTIGPPIESGFYYDFDMDDVKLSEADFEKIEAKMQEMLPTWKSFERKEVKKDEALKLFSDNEYKKELIEEFSTDGQTLTLYQSGNYVDLCRGGHSENPSKELKYFKLLSVAGAYWRGSEKNKMLTRIYGTCFPTQKELDEHLTMLEEAKKRDHRKIGKELDLFVISDLVGPGMPMYTPKGFVVRQAIIEYSRELNNRIGFQEVHTPNINKAELFKISGHYDKYKDDMLQVRSHYTDEDYFLKPMNCPQHCQIYLSQMRSYKDLPIRFSDFSNLYRDEKPGELSGLTRLRCFCQDDGHTYCREDQIEQEFKNVLGVINEALRTYGLSYWIRLSFRDPNNKEKYLGDDAVWEKSQRLLKAMLEQNHVNFVEAEGEAAFYGPKMDIIARDSLGRDWQISTIQLDLNMPSRFGLTYTDSDGVQKTPVMIHRALVGSPERFMGVLIEHYAGAFPLWLSPVQVQLAPVSEKHVEGAQKLAEELRTQSIRAAVDDANETIGNKVRKATLQKIPYIVVVGDKELAGEEWMIRVRGEADQVKMEKEEFVEKMKREITERL